MTTPEFPPVHAADLDAASVSALFTDLSAMAQVLEVRVKGGAQAYAGGASVGLLEARGSFERREVLGVQVRYLHDGGEWCDTLMRAGDAVRIVRVRVA